MRRSITRPMPVAALGLFLVGALVTPVRGEGDPSPALRMNLDPLPVQEDPGPSRLVGAEEGQEKGTHFLWVDVQVEGIANVWRVYFDYQDKKHFHFLERKDRRLFLGLCEGGVEQVFATAATPDDGQEWRRLRIARHGGQIGIFREGTLLVSAFDDRLMGGSVGWRKAEGAGELTVKAERRADVHFADDFMREEKEKSAWRNIHCSALTGDFRIRNLRHPLLSANAFCYFGAGSDVLSVVGEPWWDNYRFEAALRGLKDSAMGLVVAFQDEKNYGLFRWSAKRLDAKGAVASKGYREIVLVTDGEEKVLAREEGGYLPEAWYRAEVLMTYARLRVAVDGHMLFEVTHPRLASGGAGLWCDVPLPPQPAKDPKALPFPRNGLWEMMQQHAVFDDVKIDSVENIEDDFRSRGPLAHGWLPGTGSWTVVAERSGQPGELHALPGPWASKSLIGDRNWGQYQLECEVDPGTGTAGLVFLYRDESNHFLVRTDRRILQLVRVAQGSESVVDEATLPAGGEPWIGLTASVKDSYLRVTGPGGAEVRVLETGTLRGRAGLLATQGRDKTPARFRRFRLDFLREREPLVTTNAIFEDEKSMADWNSPTSEWYPPMPGHELKVDGMKVDLFWHRSQFPGDVELVLEPREIQEPQHDIALSVSKDGQGRNNGYVFRYRAGVGSTQAGKKGTVVELLRQGETVEEQLLPENVRELSSVSLRRAGPYVVGKVNGQPVLAWRDPKPLEGSRVAYYTKGVEARVEAAKIVSDRFRNELFSCAPVDWRLAGTAIAEVANRWQCDPRWSFFSLKNDIERRTEGKAAVLWSKYLYPGDVTVEAFVGNKMENERGRPYSYARDINLTICSDGKDLSKGYTFSFGGYDNRETLILRNGVPVKTSGLTIPRDMNYHRHWFSIRVVKRGEKLTYRVDRYFSSTKYQQPEGEMVYIDEKPLEGNRIALWTCDHALMISRVRISGEGGLTAEHPDQADGQLNTYYEE